MPYRCKCVNCGLEFYATFRNEPALMHLRHTMKSHPHDLRRTTTKKISGEQYRRRFDPRHWHARRNARHLVARTSDHAQE